MRLEYFLRSFSIILPQLLSVPFTFGWFLCLWTGPCLLSVFLQRRGEQNKLRRLWSSDRHCLQRSSCGGQVTTESCSFQRKMSPLSLLPQRRDSRCPHSHPSCVWLCVCVYMDISGRKSPVCLLDLSLFIDCKSQFGGAWPGRFKAGLTSRTYQDEKQEQARTFYNNTKHIKFRSLWTHVGLLQILPHAISACKQVWYYKVWKNKMVMEAAS